MVRHALPCKRRGRVAVARVKNSKPSVDIDLLRRMAEASPAESLRHMDSSVSGLSVDEAEKRLYRYGLNEVAREIGRAHV